MTGHSKLERAALASTLTRVGPDAPTLCEGWTTRDLAAHLVIRERRPDAAAGVVVAALAEHTQKVQDQYADQSWAALVDLVRQGPRGWNPVRVPALDDAINLVEFFVHHEDVLRAQPTWDPTHARDVDPEESAALWARLKAAGQLLVRRSPVGITFVAPGHEPKTVKAPTRGGFVTITGEPGELVLFALGRGAHAVVEITGEDAAVEAVRAAPFGL